jgi:hypothetical protein
MINGLVTNLYSTFHGIFEPTRSRLYSLERGWAAAGCLVGRLVLRLGFSCLRRGLVAPNACF